jgi:DNA-binding NarL/FixJ family response regulator
MSITVLVVDEERIFADAVAAQLGAEHDITAVAAVHPARRDECLIAGRHADVMLLDADLSGGNANSVCEELTTSGAPSRVIMLSDSSEPERIVVALRAGASAWVRKDESLEHLLRVVRCVARGETHLPAAQTGAVLRILMRAQDRRQQDDTLLAALTPREREVLACLASGAKRDDVAKQLYLSANTVRTHLQNLMAKLGVHSSLEAVALSRRAQVDCPPPVRS